MKTYRTRFDLKTPVTDYKEARDWLEEHSRHLADAFERHVADSRMTHTLPAAVRTDIVSYVDDIRWMLDNKQAGYVAIDAASGLTAAELNYLSAYLDTWARGELGDISEIHLKEDRPVQYEASFRLTEPVSDLGEAKIWLDEQSKNALVAFENRMGYDMLTGAYEGFDFRDDVSSMTWSLDTEDTGHIVVTSSHPLTDTDLTYLSDASKQWTSEECGAISNWQVFEPRAESVYQTGFTLPYYVEDTEEAANWLMEQSSDAAERFRLHVDNLISSGSYTGPDFSDMVTGISFSMDNGKAGHISVETSRLLTPEETKVLNNWANDWAGSELSGVCSERGFELVGGNCLTLSDSDLQFGKASDLSLTTDDLTFAQTSAAMEV